MTDEERAMLYPIILTKYNSEWKEWFKTEKANLEKYIGKENIVSIQHIGSTSVEGLTAKPIVDILLETPKETDIEKIKVAFPKSEYICLDRQTIPTNDILLFLNGYTDKGFADEVFHIHVRFEGDWDEIYFRDYLITHPNTAAEYAALKLSLKDKFEHDRDGYTNAKGEFIAKVTKAARNERT